MGIVALTFAGWLPAAEPVRPKEAPQQALVPPPPLSPEESRRKIRLPAGFQVELAAAEPLVLDPVAFDWDERGRLWVVEMADYPLGMDGKGKAGGRVRILEDTNGDGVYDRASLFADELSFPTGILTWRGGCLVSAAPDLLLLEDRDHDGRAEVRDVLFTGFNPGNQQLRINGLRWGADGWVYCANGGHHVNYGKDVSITSTRTGRKVPLGARDFRFKPDTGELDPLSGPAQFGRTRDAWGRWFGVQNSYPLWHYVLEDYHLRRNPHVVPPSPKVVLTESNPRVYPVLEPEQRYHNFAQAGRYTSACGPLIVADPLLFGPTAAGVEDALVCEPVHGLVQRLRLIPDGTSFKAERVGDQAADFFASGDRWCRPVMVRTGPDGALWVADMYRYMIEHPQWLPAAGQQDLAPHYRIGADRGRVYRVFPDGRRPGGVEKLGDLPPGELAERLASPNGWLRDKAQMLLVWRGQRDVVPALERLARDRRRSLGRMHALHTLEQLGALPDELIIDALADPEPGVRIQALVLAEPRPQTAVVTAALKRIDDPDPKVRLQLACALGAWPQPEAGRALAILAQRDGGDPVVRGAVVSSLVPHLAAFAAGFNGDETLREATFQTALGEQRDDVLLALIEAPLAGAVATDRASLERARSALMLLRARQLALETLAGRHPGDARWAAVVARKNALLAATRQAQASATPAERAFLATLLLCDPAEEAAAVEQLGELLAPRHGLNPIGEYVTHLVRAGGAQRVPELLLQDWERRTPGEQAVILDAIMGRDAWVPALLERVGPGRIPAASFDAQRQARLLKHPSAAIRRQASSVFSATSGRPRAQVLAAFRPALSLPGDARKGRAVFVRTCSACHLLEGTGTALGPDLRSVVEHPPEKLLSAILDPSADIQPGYAAYFCELRSGEHLYGSIAAETGESLAFRLADGSTRAVVRAEIKSLQSSNVSLMPEGLEASQTAQSMADLIAYLKQPK